MLIKIAKRLKDFALRRLLPFCRMAFYNTVCKGWIKLFGTKDKRELKYKISLCLIFKNEAPFLKEWIDYHLTVGVDHFYLYNNESDDHYLEVLRPYLDEGIVTLIDFPGRSMQVKAYQHCMEHFREETNWISFLDADEFFVPKYADTIGEWLRPFEKFPAVNIHWRMFGTGGVEKHDYSKNVTEQYFMCWDKWYPHGKCLVNTRYDVANWDSWYAFHHCYMRYKVFGIRFVLPAVNQFGYMCLIDNTWGGGKDKNKSATLLINHYFTKAWDIYSAKMHKTDAFFSTNPKADYSYFYKYEMQCRTQDYTICRFLIKMKIRQGLLK